VLTTIGELCNLINGKAFKPTDWTEDGLPIVRIQNLNRPDAPYNHFGGEVADKFKIDSGQLLFAWSGTPGTSFGAHVWNGGPAVLNQHIFKVEIDERSLDKAFFRRAINQTLDELIHKAHGGVGLRHVTKGVFEGTEVPLPPLAEQRRIVAKLDQFSARVRAAKDHLAHVQTLATRAKQATLAAAFRGELTADWRELASATQTPISPREIKRRKGKVQDAPFEAPFAIPTDWRWLRLPELGELNRGKSKHRPRNDPALYGSDYPFVQTGDVRAADRYLSEFSKSYSEFGLAQSRLWPLGTVCITIAANIAETAILAIEACFPDSVVGFTADHERTSPEYIEYFIRTVRDELSAYAPATAQKNINLETLYGVRAPVPPLEEQTEIVGRIEAAFARIDRMVAEAAKALALLERLEQQLLAKAFRGELVPQDPNDEPASALLARIREARANAPKPKRTRKKKAAS
jgi:type I restriction enzyme S subunit